MRFVPEPAAEITQHLDIDSVSGIAIVDMNDEPIHESVVAMERLETLRGELRL